MNRRAGRAAGLVVMLGLAGCQPSGQDAAGQAPASGPAPVPAPASASLAGYAGLRIGGRLADVPAAAGLVAAGMRELMQGDCEYYSQGPLPAGMSMMVLGERIARFDAAARGDAVQAAAARPADAPALPYGLWVGMGMDTARQQLPAGVVSSPHAYAWPDGEYLTWTDKTGPLALRLETLDGVVTAIYWGQPDAVELIEGCA